MVDGESVAALEADGDALSQFFGAERGVRAVLLKHERCVSDLKPAPANFFVDDPLSGALKAEAFDVEAEGGSHVGDHEKGNGLLDVGFVASHWLLLVSYFYSEGSRSGKKAMPNCEIARKRSLVSWPEVARVRGGCLR